MSYDQPSPDPSTEAGQGHVDEEVVPEPAAVADVGG